MKLTAFQRKVFDRFVGVTGHRMFVSKCENDYKKVIKAVTQFYKTITKEDPSHYFFESVIKKNPKEAMSEINSALMYHSTDIQNSPFWRQFISKEQIDNIRSCVLTYYPQDKRHEYFLDVFSGVYSVNTDEIPDGAPLSPKMFDGVLTVNPYGTFFRLTSSHTKIHVIAKITTWKGISIGAEHYYACLQTFYFRPSYVPVAPTKDEWEATYLDDRFQSRVAKMGDITIRRPLTKADIKMAKSLSNRDRYEAYSLGDPIDGFWEKEAAIEAATKAYKNLFDTKQVSLQYYGV